eukprot:1535777-Ditylum_brightwellii.AAC.1
MTQHKEECGKDENGNLEIISRRGDDEDSGEEFGNEGAVKVRKSMKDASEAPLSKAKGESLNEEGCDVMEEKEKRNRGIFVSSKYGVWI